MQRRKIALLLCIVTIAMMALSACSLFGGGSEDEGGLPELKKRYYYVPGDYFVTNVKDSKMLSKTSIALLCSKDKSDVLGQNQDGIRNAIVKILREKTEADLFADNAIDNLETEMTSSLKTLLDMEEFIQVEISDFIVQ